jgi:hypothetical protein
LPARLFLITLFSSLSLAGRPQDLSDAALLAAETFNSPINSVDSDTNKDRGSHLATALKVDVEASSSNRNLDEAETTAEDDLSAPLMGKEGKAKFLSSESLGRNSSAGRGFKSLKDLPHYQVGDAHHPSRGSGLSSLSVRSRVRGGSLAVSVLSENVDTEYELGHRIPWAQFFLNRTSRTLLFTWWVMAWISK